MSLIGSFTRFAALVESNDCRRQKEEARSRVRKSRVAETSPVQLPRGCYPRTRNERPTTPSLMRDTGQDFELPRQGHQLQHNRHKDRPVRFFNYTLFTRSAAGKPAPPGCLPRPGCERPISGDQIYDARNLLSTRRSSFVNPAAFLAIPRVNMRTWNFTRAKM